MRAKAGDGAKRNVRQIGMMTERLPRMYVGQVYLDERQRGSEERVTNRDARVGEGGRIDHNHVYRARGGMDSANKLVFGVRLKEVELELAEPSIWDDPDRAQALGREPASLEAVVTTIETLDTGCDDASDLLDLAVEEDDDGALAFGGCAARRRVR